MRLSAPLRPGDPVAVIAPAGPVPAERYETGLRVLSSRYQVRTAPGLLSRAGFLAGEDGRRLAELRWALADPEVRAVFCGRGGYGALRYLPALLSVRSEDLRPVPLCGFSDITVILAWLYQTGVASIHGPVVTQLGQLPPDDVAALFGLLESAAPPPPLGELSCLVPGVARGRLWGGNLELLSRLCGTGLPLPQDEPILLLLEEIGEQPYRLDRALTQLLLSGALRAVAGVIIGDLVDCKSNDPGIPDPLSVFVERLRPLGVPIAAGAPIGHGAKNRAVPIGALAELDASAGVLRFAHGAVSEKQP